MSTSRRVIVLTVSGALCIGLAVGAGVGVLGFREDARTTDQYQALQADNNALQGEHGILQGEYEDLQSELEAAVTTAEDAQSAQRLAEKALDKSVGDIEAREKVVEQSRRRLQALNGRLDARQKALDAAEKKAKRTLASSSIPGDGLYLVGDDIDAGKYASVGATGCYYASRTADTLFVTNDTFTNKAAIVNLNEGEYFKTVGCADWVMVV